MFSHASAPKHQKTASSLAAGSRVFGFHCTRQLGSDTRFPVSVPFYRVHNKPPLPSPSRSLSLSLSLSFSLRRASARPSLYNDLPRRADNNARERRSCEDRRVIRVPRSSRDDSSLIYIHSRVSRSECRPRCARYCVKLLPVTRWGNDPSFNSSPSSSSSCSLIDVAAFGYEYRRCRQSLDLCDNTFPRHQ